MNAFVFGNTQDRLQAQQFDLLCLFFNMLVRPLIYTAITRAKEKVLIVGERRALCTAIRRIDTEQRGTKLAQRIHDFSK